jgi:hypothetical protein
MLAILKEQRQDLVAASGNRANLSFAVMFSQVIVEQDYGSVISGRARISSKMIQIFFKVPIMRTLLVVRVVGTNTFT